MNLAATLHFPAGLPSLASLAAFKPSLPGLRRWLAGSSASEVRPMQRHSLRQMPSQKTCEGVYSGRPQPELATKSVAVHAHSTRAKAKYPALRVLRVHDGGPARQGVGRMVISGRMADVCAELDRLAALEAQAFAPAPTR